MGGGGEGSHWKSSGIIISKNRALFLIEYSDGVSHLEGLEKKRKVGLGAQRHSNGAPDSFFFERENFLQPPLCSLTLRFDGHSSVGTLKITSCKKRAWNGTGAAARVLHRLSSLSLRTSRQFVSFGDFKPARHRGDRKISLLWRRSLWFGYFSSSLSFLSPLFLLSSVRKKTVALLNRFYWI